MPDDVNVRINEEIADIIDRHRETLSREDFIDLCVKSFLKNQEVRVPKEGAKEKETSRKGFPGERYIKDPILIAIWMTAVVTYGLGDLVTTSWAFSLGLVESNPVTDTFRNIVNMALFKAATMIAAFLISFTLFGNKTLAYGAPLLIVGAGVVLTVSNAIQILRVI